VALLFVSVIGAIQWRFILSVLQSHGTVVTFCQCYRRTVVALLFVL
jgi:hypothetical protein